MFWVLGKRIRGEDFYLSESENSSLLITNKVKKNVVTN